MITKFNTHELDQTGLSYFNARYYDVDTGRFFSPDPTVPKIDSTQHYNRYMFVAGNPISFMNASGYSEEEGGTQGTTSETTGNGNKTDSDGVFHQNDNNNSSTSSNNNSNNNNAWDDFWSGISEWASESYEWAKADVNYKLTKAFNGNDKEKMKAARENFFNKMMDYYTPGKTGDGTTMFINTNYSVFLAGHTALYDREKGRVYEVEPNKYNPDGGGITDITPMYRNVSIGDFLDTHKKQFDALAVTPIKVPNAGKLRETVNGNTGVAPFHFLGNNCKAYVRGLLEKGDVSPRVLSNYNINISNDPIPVTTAGGFGQYIAPKDSDFWEGVGQ
jgi:RHS repeat-associated protein